MSDANQRPAEPQWAAFVAIDWADKKHFWRLAPADGGPQECAEMESTPEAINVWATGLSARFAGRPIAVCFEQSKGPLVCALAKYAHLVLLPVHPTTAAKYRETFRPSGAKSDSSDTVSLLDLLLRHREELRALQPDTPETRLLRELVEGRRLLVNEKTRQKNRLTACLEMYFPQMLHWFDSVDSQLVTDLLQRWPTLGELKRTHPGTLKKFFLEHNCRGEEHIRERLAAISAAMPLTEDKAIVLAESMKAMALVEIIAVLRGQITEYEKRIAALVAEHPESRLFGSLPGAGPVTIPRLIAAFGTRRERFQSAYELQCLSGIAPVTEQSGPSEWVHFRRGCPKFLHQTFHEYARQSLQKSLWAKAYYEAARKTANRITRLSDRWLLNGSESSSAAGRTANSMMNKSTFGRSSAPAPH